MLQEKPQIAFFSLAYYPFEGGAEVAAREIIKRLKDFSFTIFTYKFDKGWLIKENKENAEIIRVGYGGSGHKKYGRIFDKIIYVFKAWRAAEELHKKNHFKVIWAMMASYGGIAALFFKLSHPNIPMLLTIQEGDCERHLIFGKFGLVGFFGKKIIQKADYIQVISNYLKDFIIKRGANCPIEVIPNGVDLDFFSTTYDDGEMELARKGLGIKDEYVVVTTSRLVYKNGVDVLVEAIGKLKDKTPIKCLIIGGGPEQNKLKKRVEDLKIEDKVIFLGQIAQKDIPLYLKISDIFVRVSRSEGLGNSFLEAMAAGIPVIGTRAGGIVDFLVDGVTGFFVEIDDAENLAQKIKYILNNSELRKKVVENSLYMVQKNYSWDMLSGYFKAIFDKLINQR
ncbi:MAG: hypothetical protein Athens071426_437 [Parcubacteria group bacterium Athens0714_26]|nr:MAG: hypothetical protein Athens101426_119 [Parcubacteria group bacterium Athens1014_26]TSD02621.1 MAG: hypothetical protein Athens071426_437 [Parcubacteria group bacterium Athens0714_26]